MVETWRPLRLGKIFLPLTLSAFSAVKNTSSTRKRETSPERRPALAGWMGTLALSARCLSSGPSLKVVNVPGVLFDILVKLKGTFGAADPETMPFNFPQPAPGHGPAPLDGLHRVQFAAPGKGLGKIAKAARFHANLFALHTPPPRMRASRGRFAYRDDAHE